MASQGSKAEADPQLGELKAPLIRLGLELGPLIVFFTVNTLGERWLEQSPLLSSWFSQPIIFATAVFMVAMAVSLLLSWLLLKRVAVMPLVTGVVVLVFGSLTLIFQDATFIKMKPTIVNALFGAVLLGGLLFGQSLLRYVFGDVYRLKARGWWILTVRWGIFFFVLAALNEIVWRGADALIADPKAANDLWVAFKVWGIMPLTVVFSMFQLPVLKAFAPDPEPPNPVPPTIEP
ncbi:MAG TPA: septation protein A [Alphaproteobacteria bacterium]|nr:septation protein A [Alphaproteobacteria bacterium]